MLTQVTRYMLTAQNQMIENYSIPLKTPTSRFLPNQAIYLCLGLSVTLSYPQIILAQSVVKTSETEKPQDTPQKNTEAQSTTTSNTDTTAKDPSKSATQVKVEKVPSQVKNQPKRGEDIYKDQIAQIEEQVNELKEEVFRSRTRIDILKETVLAIGISDAQVEIIHRNEMGANFKLERVLYSIDGSTHSYDLKTTPDLDAREELTIFKGQITPENHTILVELIYRGNGFGIFSYLQAYRFTLNNTYSFRPENGKRHVIKGVAYEKEGLGLDLTERPAIRFDVSEIDIEQKRPDGK